MKNISTTEVYYNRYQITIHRMTSRVKFMRCIAFAEDSPLCN
jgi:hypothetical protein